MIFVLSQSAFTSVFCWGTAHNSSEGFGKIACAAKAALFGNFSYIQAA
jgi:hypothetical protein